VVNMVFDNIIIDREPFGAALGTGFYVNVCHSSFFLGTFAGAAFQHTRPKEFRQVAGRNARSYFLRSTKRVSRWC
jgi:hypothetical protein